jgi:hypothetical protein
MRLPAMYDKPISAAATLVVALLIVAGDTGPAESNKATRANCQKRFDNCLLACQKRTLDTPGMCVSLCYKNRDSCGADSRAQQGHHSWPISLANHL